MDYIGIKKDNDRLFLTGQGVYRGMKSEYISDFTPVKCVPEEKYVLSDNTRKQTTVECILSNAGKNIIALNFANGVVPGGGYALGAKAQEESLCRASMLYYTIKTVKEFYAVNRKHFIADYTDGMIYSENVPVIRDDSGEYLERPVLCNFITCPAVNRTELIFMSRQKTNKIMERRIEKIVSFAVSKKPDVIILGAFGCGAYGNNREDILPLFEKAINNCSDGKSEIIFAIP